MPDISAARLPTGIQYEITHGTARARIGSVAAVLREFSVAGVHYTEVTPDDRPTPHGSGIVLVPWPNRIAGGVWTLDGRPQKLDLTDRGHNAASHGLLRNTSYELVEIDDSAVTLGASIYPQHGYPFTLDTVVTYRLSDDGLHVTHRIANVGAGSAPFGVGAHPYLRVGDTPVKELRVTVDADTYFLLDDDKSPIGTAPVAGTEVDLRDGVRLDAVSLDTCYTDLRRAGEHYTATLAAPDGSGLVLWGEEPFSYIQVFTPRDFPGRDLAVAVEPMTCPANAFNTGEGLRWLPPGETFEAAWGLRPTHQV